MKVFAIRHYLLLLSRTMIVLSCIVSLLMLPLQAVTAQTSTIEYYYYNHQGSLLEVYDGNSNRRLLSQAWSPWGERQVLQASASGDKNNGGHLLAHGLPAHMGYTGHKQLLATGLVFAGDTRLYDARLKRFLNSDDRTTGGVKGQNRYSYAYNNPMTYIDPDGRMPEDSRLGNRRTRLLYLRSLLGGTGRIELRNNNFAEVPARFRQAHNHRQKLLRQAVIATGVLSGGLATAAGVAGWLPDSTSMLVAGMPMLAASLGSSFSAITIMTGRPWANRPSEFKSVMRLSHNIASVTFANMLSALPFAALDLTTDDYSHVLPLFLGSLILTTGHVLADRLFIANKHHWSAQRIIQSGDSELQTLLPRISMVMLGHSTMVASSSFITYYLYKDMSDSFDSFGVNMAMNVLHPVIYSFTRMLQVGIEINLSHYHSTAGFLGGVVLPRIVAGIFSYR